MISDEPFPDNLTAIDELTRGDHHYLDENDACYFLGEYTRGKPWDYSPTNGLIKNLKKKPDLRGTPQWKWKLKAMRNSSRALLNALPEKWLEEGTFVPIPPSKVAGHPLYDDRVTKILNGINDDIDVRELIVQTESTDPDHENNESRRRRPDEILELYEINRDLLTPAPKRIVLCDDMITNGAHFKAAKTLLRGHFPRIPIQGVFISRRIFPEADFEEDFDND